MTKIYVTGLGVRSPLGSTPDTYWRALLDSEVEPKANPDLPDGSMPIRNTYAMDAAADTELSAPFGGRAAGFAVAAARAALADAGIAPEAAAHIGVCLGSAMGDDTFEAQRHPKDSAGNEPAPNSGFSFDAAAAVASALGLEGPNLCVTTACSAGLYSISLAADLIREGRAEALLVGGAESICRVAMGCFNRLAAIDPVACRPFGTERAGTVMGEGAALLLIESQAHFERRGGSFVYGEIYGEGWSCDSYHATIPEPTGHFAVLAAERALRQAATPAEDVHAVLAHGTGTLQNDAMESKMIQALFGSEAARAWVCGVKGKLGHQGGAAGAFQAMTAALMLKYQRVPPTGNTTQPDPECPVALAPPGGVEAKLERVIMNSYAFGGNNISLIMGKP